MNSPYGDLAFTESAWVCSKMVCVRWDIRIGDDQRAGTYT